VWSPDGTRIAFQSVRGENYDVEVIGTDGRQRVRLTDDAMYDGSHDWSRDGTQVTFISGRDGHDAVYSIGVTGGPARRLTSEPSLDPRWSRR
jgi:TolB protein